ncbi:MAG: hypothetical protein C4542_06320 [Dehalococcoidia bacterium]|nr:MAG: hypothetical protein C4542_06320 [Dehalococcoidia bacterium]
MKNILSILVAVIGVVCIVFGVLFIMQAGDSKTIVVDELKASGVTLDNLDAKYDAAKAGLAQALGAGAAGTETAQSVGWQKTSLGLAKSNLGTIDFVQKSGILAIVIGAGLTLAGVGLMKKS